MKSPIRSVFFSRFLLLIASSFTGTFALGNYQFTTLSAEASSSNPSGIAVDNIGNVYVSESGDNVIRKITPAGVVSTFAGLAGASGNTDGMGANARFSFPQGLAVDSTGNIYVADAGNNSIRKITASGQVSTFAFGFNAPWGVSVDGSGNVYVADTYNHVIQKISGASVTIVAGAVGVSGNADGTGATARFKNPTAVTTDSLGNIYVADTANHTIRKISLDGVVTTLAGMEGVPTGPFGYVDATGAAARFTFPHGLAVDKNANVYVADTYNNVLRKVTSAGVVTTFAGASSQGNIDGSNSVVRFNLPYSLAIDSQGNFYVADFGNNSVRKGAPPPIITSQPGSRSVITGTSTTLAVVASGVPTPSYQWYKDAVVISGATSASYTIANVAMSDAGSYTVVVTNTVGSTLSDPAVLTVISNAGISGRVLGDFDGDGKADLVWTNSVTGERSMWFLNGNTTSGGASLGMIPVAWVVSATADFNGDGKGDVFLTNTVNGDRAMWLMNGSIIQTNAFMGTVPVEWTISGTGDFNGDGKADVVWTNIATGDRAMWLLNGSTVLGGGYLGTVPTVWQISGVGDFNGDGKADLVWSNTATGERSMWFQNGSTTTGGATIGTVPPVWTIAGVGDFNGDGKADIFLTNVTTGDRVIWLMNGSTIVTNAFMGTIPVAWTISGTGDFNSDGKKDLFWTNTSTGDRAMWLLNGATVTGGGYMGTVPVVWRIN